MLWDELFNVYSRGLFFYVIYFNDTLHSFFIEPFFKDLEFSWLFSRSDGFLFLRPRPLGIALELLEILLSFLIIDLDFMEIDF